MIHILSRRCLLISAAFAAPKVEDTVNSLSSEPKQSKWEKVYNAFTPNEYGDVSPHLNTIYQTTIFSAFFGACYGGFIHSREAYLNFIERNEASQYKHHFEAKKKLQDFVTVNFAKGAFKWSWRIALFSGLYVTFVTVLGVYFDGASVWHYGLAGLISGGIYKINLGLRGFVAGGTLGLMMGLFAGALTSTIFYLTGSTLDDVQQWQHEIQESRNKHIGESARKALSQDKEMLMKDHDERNVKTAKTTDLSSV